jgi:7-keto-8-aminopelargonate synthetase-like enzyme
VSPAVETGHALIRTSYMASHEDSHLSRAIEIVQQAGRDLGLIN